MRNAATEQIIDLKPEKVEVLAYVSPREKTVMLLVALLLTLAAFALSQRKVELPHVTPILKQVFIEEEASFTPATQRIELGEHIPVRGHLRASMDETIASLQATIDEATKTLEKQQAISNAEAALYKTQLGDTSLSEEEQRELLLKAGLKPAKRKQLPPPIQEKQHVDGLELSHSIAKQLVRDEVEGFILKVKLATQVGEYLFSD